MLGVSLLRGYISISRNSSGFLEAGSTFASLFYCLVMCDLSVLVEDYSSLPPAAKLEVTHSVEEYVMRVIIGMLPVLVWIARTAREAVARTASVTVFSIPQVHGVRPCGHKRRRASASNGARVLHLVVWGSPSTGYWTSLSLGSNKRQVFTCCHLLLHCVVCGCGMCGAGCASSCFDCV